MSYNQYSGYGGNPYGGEQQSYGADEARRDWLDVVEGGNGPWPPAPHQNVSPEVRAKWPEEGSAHLA